MSLGPWGGFLYAELNGKSRPSRENEAQGQVASWAKQVMNGSCKMEIQTACVVSAAWVLGHPCPAMGKMENCATKHPASSRATTRPVAPNWSLVDDKPWVVPKLPLLQQYRETLGVVAQPWPLRPREHSLHSSSF